MFLVLFGCLLLGVSWAQGIAGHFAFQLWDSPSIEFGERPDLASTTKGFGWGAKRKGLWRPGFEVQRGITKWFSGIQLKPIRTIEYAWWYSPEFVSLRLGYLAASEYWNEAELMKRWKTISIRMQGNMSFFVQLASAPEYDLIEDEFIKKGDINEIENVRFLLFANGKSMSPRKAFLVREETSRSPAIFTSQPWYLYAPGADCLLSEFESPFQETGLPLGDHDVRIYRIDFNLDDLKGHLTAGSKLSLRVLSANRERRAEWSLR